MNLTPGFTDLITAGAIVFIISQLALQASALLMNVLRTMIQAWGVNLGPD